MVLHIIAIALVAGVLSQLLFDHPIRVSGTVAIWSFIGVMASFSLVLMYRSHAYVGSAVAAVLLAALTAITIFVPSDAFWKTSVIQIGYISIGMQMIGAFIFSIQRFMRNVDVWYDNKGAGNVQVGFFCNRVKRHITVKIINLPKVHMSIFSCRCKREHFVESVESQKK